MFDALCHQGDIYTASYAAVPHILEYIAKSGSGWQPYALIASIEEARLLGKGPAIPAELEGNYHDAITSAVSLALQAFPHTSEPLLSRSIIALLSLANGQISIATFSLLDESEQADWSCPLKTGQDQVSVWRFKNSRGEQYPNALCG
jgi:hypothetical protein